MSVSQSPARGWWHFARHSGLSWPAVAGLVLLGGIALALRLWELDRRSLWTDEIIQSWCGSLSLPDLLACVHAGGVQTPLAYLVQHFFYSLEGSPPMPEPAWYVRVPAVLAGLATIPFAASLARELLGPRALWPAALVWSVAPLGIEYSQEARMYAWLSLFSTASALSLIVGLRRPNVKAWLGFGFFTALNLYSHYAAFVVLAAQGIFAALWLAARTSREWHQASSAGHRLAVRHAAGLIVYGLFGMIVAVILYLPWAPELLTFFGFMGGQGKSLSWFASAPLTFQYAANLLTWLFSGLPRYPAAPVSRSALLVLSPLLVLGIFWMFRRARTALLFTGCWLLVPITYLVLTRGMPVTFRYVLFLQVGYYVILTAGVLALGDLLVYFAGRGSTSKALPYIRTVPGIAWVILMALPGLYAAYTVPFDDWRGVAAYLRAHASPGDVILSLDENAAIPQNAFSYYLPGPPASVPIVTLDQIDAQMATHLRTQTAQVWGVWLNVSANSAEQLRQWGGAEWRPLAFSNLFLLVPQPNAPQSTSAAAGRLLRDYLALNPNRSLAALSSFGFNLQVGPNLLSNPDFAEVSGNAPMSWELTAALGEVILEENVPLFELSRGNPNGSVNAVQRVRLKSDQMYILRLECRHAQAEGDERVYVTFVQGDGAWIAFPGGEGLSCPATGRWESLTVPFRVPPADRANPEATIWLRNLGDGPVYFRHVQLFEVARP